MGSSKTLRTGAARLIEIRGTAEAREAAVEQLLTTMKATDRPSNWIPDGKVWRKLTGRLSNKEVLIQFDTSISARGGSAGGSR